MSMRVKVEFELEDGDLTTLINTFALLFNKIDISKIINNKAPKPSEENIEDSTNIPTNNTADIPNGDIYYYNGEPTSNTIPKKIDEKKKD